MLEIKNLTYRIKKKSVIEDVSYYFMPGVYGLLGPNGAGKTTIMRCITGVYSLKQPAIFYDGEEAIKNKNFLNIISYLPQEFGLFKDLKVKEMMIMLASLRGINTKNDLELVERCLELVNMSDKLNDKVRTLSGGMIRRLGIAQTLLNDPKIIIFDEPTAGLDIEERLRFKNIISEIRKDRVIIISTHIATDIESLCDQVLVMNEGKVIFTGSCEQVANQANHKGYILPEDKLASIEGKYHIQNYFEKDSKNFTKIVSHLRIDDSDIECVEPTIEDGYICLIKEI